MSDDTGSESTALVPIARQCVRVKRNGQRCRKSAMLGQSICDHHGGKAGHNLRAARRRLLSELWNPAIGTLETAMERYRRTGVDRDLIIAVRAAMGVIQHSADQQPQESVYEAALAGLSTLELAERAARLAEELAELAEAEARESVVAGGDVIDADFIVDADEVEI
jgi:hypothetical protein